MINKSLLCWFHPQIAVRFILAALFAAMMVGMSMTATAQTTSIPNGPAVIVSVNPTNANPGDSVEVSISVANITGLYGLQTECTVDPNVLAGVSHADGTIFNTGDSFFVDPGYSAGQWTVAATLLQPSVAFSGAAVAYKLNYTVQNVGSSPVTCTALAVDSNGRELPVEVVNASFDGGVVVEPTVQPTLEPTLEPSPVEPTIEPTLESTVEPTVEPTLEPSPVEPTMEPTLESTVEPTVEPPPVQLSTISGVVSYQNHPDNAGITVQLVTSDTVLATVTTNADGSFSFTDVQVGSYGVTAAAPEHLRIGKVVDVTAGGQTIDTGKMTLPAGDTDDNGSIDLLDASLVGANFDSAVPPSPANADLNLDGKVDIHDLALIGGNFGMTGPVVIP